MGDGSSSSSESDSDLEVKITFKRGAKRTANAEDVAGRKAQRTLEMAQQEAETTKLANTTNKLTDLVDDTDGLDPEKERAEWVEREKQRMLREYEELKLEDERAQRAHAKRS